MAKTGIRGRPTKFSPQIALNLCKWIRKGNAYIDACRMEGIHYDTFNEWRRHFPDFSVAVERSEALCKRDCIDRIHKAEAKDWKAAAWILERRFPEEYSLRTSRLEKNAIIEGSESALRVMSALVRVAEEAVTK